MLSKELSRGGLVFRPVEEFLRDLRVGFRLLVRSPGASSSAVLSLALGIGANTAIFSLIDAVLLRMLPVRAPEQLVRLQKFHPRGPSNISYPLFRQLRESSQVFSGVFATGGPGRSRIQVDGEVETVTGELVSGNYFAVLGVPAAVGRTLNLEDEAKRQPVAVLGYRYWQRRFGANPAVIGKTVTVGDDTVTIVGVAAPEFWGVEVGYPVDVWRPVTMMQGDWLANPGFNWLTVMARLRPETGRRQAQAWVDVIFRQFLEESAGSLLGQASSRELQEHWAQRIERGGAPNPRDRNQDGARGAPWGCAVDGAARGGAAARHRRGDRPAGGSGSGPVGFQPAVRLDASRSWDDCGGDCVAVGGDGVRGVSAGAPGDEDRSDGGVEI